MKQHQMNKCRNMMYTQQLSHLPFTLEELPERLNAINPQKYAYILHNKDIGENGKPVDDHLHLMMTFKNARSINSIAKALGDKPQYIERYDRQAENGYSYLVHRTDKAKNKFQYDVASVTANFDYPDFISEIEKKVLNAAIRNDTNILLDAFKAGHINKMELEERLSGSEYGRIRSQIENIHSLILRQKAEKWRQEAIALGKTLKAFWLFGAAGTGKTSLAKQIVKKKNLSLFMSGSSKDMFQNYNGENAIIIDDLRPHAINYEDLLRITDPHSIECGINAPSRYYDKALACELIIITSPFSPRDYYFREIQTAEQRRIDTFAQLERRISLTLLLDMDYIFQVEYNRQSEQYEKDYDTKKVNNLSEKARPQKEGTRPKDIFEKIFDN